MTVKKADDGEQAGVEDVVSAPATDENEIQEVELDKPTEITGDLIENPTLEEVEDEQTDEPEDNSVEDGATDTGDEGSTEGTDNEAGDAVEDTKDEPATELESIDDPGEFKPQGDYSFEITQADGKTVKITSPEQAEAFSQRLDSEENLLTAYQFTKFQRDFGRMDRGFEREKEKFDLDKQAFDNQQAQETARIEQTTKWSNELKYLEGKELLPKIGQGIDVPGGWEKNPDDPGVKARMEIFKWMDKENADRRAAGIDTINSTVDAFRLMQADRQESEIKEEDKRDANTRRAKGKMVSGNASFTPDNQPAGRIIGEGGSLNDLVREASM